MYILTYVHTLEILFLNRYSFIYVVLYIHILFHIIMCKTKLNIQTFQPIKTKFMIIKDDIKEIWK